MGGVTKVVGSVMNGITNAFGGGQQAAPAQAAPVAAPAQPATPSYAPPPELRGTQQDAQNAIDFQNNASRRKASGNGAQMLASAGTTGSNAGTKTLLGS